MRFVLTMVAACASIATAAWAGDAPPARTSGATGQLQKTTASFPAAPSSAPVIVNCCQCIGVNPANTTLYTGVAGWHLASGSVLPANSPLYLPAPTDVPGGWTQDIPPAKWLAPYSDWGGTLLTGHYIYELQIVVRNCTIPATYKLQGYVAGDNQVTATLIGPGGPVVLGQSPSPNPNYGFMTSHIFYIGANLSANTTYTLRMDVNNDSSYTGLRVNAWVEAQCTTDVVKPSGPLSQTGTPSQ